MDFLSLIGKTIFSAGLAISSLLGFTPEPEPSFSAALPQTVAVFETSLAAPITSSATSMTLTANAIRGGGALTGFNCFTVDEGSAQAETICGTVSGTSVTNLTRGLSQSTGTTTVASLQFAHRRGANVKITDYPVIQILKAQNSGEDTFANQLLYATGVTPTNSNALTDKEYVDGLAFNGAGVIDASSIARGVVELSTGAEAAASTASGSSGILALPASIATSTYNAATAANIIPVTGLTGKLDASFLSIATTTPIGAGIAYDIGKHQQIFTVGTSTFTVPEGVQKVWVTAVGGGGPGGSDGGSDVHIRGATTTFSTFLIAEGGANAVTASEAGGGGAGAWCHAVVDVSATTSVQVVVGAGGSVTQVNSGTGGSTRTGGDGGDCSGSVTSRFEVDDMDGENAMNLSGSGESVQVGGRGGASPWGFPGRGMWDVDSSTFGPEAGKGYGAGGGGGGDSGTQNGGSGAPGIVIVSW